MTLKDVSPYSFDIYAHWVYTGHVEDNLLNFEPPFQVGDSEACQRFRCFVCAYVIADFLGDVKLKNRCMDLIIDAERFDPRLVFRSSAISFAWINTAQNSTLRNWLVDSLAATTMPFTLCANMGTDELPKELEMEVVRKLFSIRHGPLCKGPATQKKQDYHEPMD